MKMNFGIEKVSFEDVKEGDVLLTVTHQTFLIVIDELEYYRCVNLTSSVIYDENFTDSYDLCKYINDKSKVIKHVPSDNLLLSIMEGNREE